MTLFQLVGYVAEREIIMNDELENIRMEAAIACFKILFQTLAGGTEESQEESQSSKSTDRDSKAGPTEYEAG
jgi:hypothetical protein